MTFDSLPFMGQFFYGIFQFDLFLSIMVVAFVEATIPRLMDVVEFSYWFHFSTYSFKNIASILEEYVPLKFRKVHNCGIRMCVVLCLLIMDECPYFLCSSSLYYVLVLQLYFYLYRPSMNFLYRFL